MGSLLSLLLLMGSHSAAEARLWGSQDTCAYDYRKIIGVSEREAKRLEENDGYLADLPGAILGDRDERAQEVLAALRKEPLPKSPRSRRILELSRDQVNRLFDETKAIPQVTATNLCESYRGSAKSGFCFGRAVAAHLKALQHGIHNRSVRKLWALGRLEMDGEEWKYHVTTIVRVKGGEWFALDPSFEKAMPVSEWYQRMKAYDPERRLRLYATEAKRLSMVSGRPYNKARMQNDVFKGFFSDLLAEIRKTNGRHVRAEPEQDRARYEAAKKWLMGAAGVGGISAAGLYELYRMNQAQK